MILILSLTALAILSLSYITARLVTAHPRNPKVSFNSLIAPESNYDNLNGTRNENDAPEPEAASTETTTAITTPEPPATPPKTAYPPKPAAAPTAAKPELDLLRDAATALSKKQWDTAIQILESGDLYKERYDVRTLLLLEAYVESRRFGDAQALMDSAQTRDAHYLLSAGKFWFYNGNHTKAIELLESSLTRPSVSKYRNVVFCDALYYIAEIKQEQYRAAPSEPNRAAALDSWRKVQAAACGSKSGNPRFERAEKEITGIIGD
jgi:hypothetical protein